MSTMFKLHSWRALFVLVVVTVLMGALPVAAQQPQPPDVQTNCSFALKSGIPFAWLRFSPSSTASYSITMLPGHTVQSNAPATLSWDGVQWWIYIWPNSIPNVHGYYWVELSSIEPHCPQTPTPGSGAANWSQGTVVTVKPSVPFVWFRAQPAPGSNPVHTVFSNAALVVMSGPSQDNYGQWWWHMTDPRTYVYGWVEQNSVSQATAPPPTPTPVPTQWQTGDTVRVRSTVPFVWFRSTPSSNAGVIYTVGPGQTMFLQQGPLSDGVQNWWLVILPYSGRQGWVEEGSLELVRRA